MSTATYPEEIREDDGDELGALMGWHLDGHVDLYTVEAFMDSAELTEAFDGILRRAPRGFDVEHLYVRKVPCEYGCRFQYSSRPGRGLHPVTRIQQNTWWERWCLNHPAEPAVQGVHPSQVADAEPLPGDTHIYLCRPCADSFHTRQDQARREAIAAMYAERAAG